MFEVETMKHYFPWTEAQINYVTCLKSQYELDLQRGMKPQLDYHKYQKYALKQH